MKDRNTKILLILFTIILFTIGLLPYNYPTDIYNILELGFKEYAQTWFAPSGRTIGMICFFILEKCYISYELYIIIMKICAIIISTICIYFLYGILIRIDNTSNKMKKNAYVVAALATLLNRSTYQFFYYTESMIMWLGVLFIILALKNTIENTKSNKYFITAIYIFIAINCYQAVVLFYLPAILILLSTKIRNIKEFFAELLKNSFIVIINLLICYGILKFLANYYNVKTFRNTELVLNFKLLLWNFDLIFRRMVDGGYNIILSYIYTFVIFISFCLVPESFVNKKHISVLSIVLAIIIGFIEVVGIISVLDFYCGDRIQFVYVSMVGLSFIYFLLNIKIDKSQILIKFILFAGIIYLIINILNSNHMSYNSRIVRERDKDILNSINNAVLEYEKDNKISIERVEYCYDDNYVRCDYDIRKTLEATQRIMASEWVLENSIKYTLKNNITIQENPEIYSKVFEEKSWDSFNIKEQVKFDNNIMYYCIY